MRPSIASEPTCDCGVALAVDQVKRLHRPTFGDGYTHFAGSTSQQRRRLSQHVQISHSALQLEPERSGLFGSHLSGGSQLLLCRDSDMREAAATI
jgi:hypothetical protein